MNQSLMGKLDMCRETCFGLPASFVLTRVLSLNPSLRMFSAAITLLCDPSLMAIRGDLLSWVLLIIFLVGGSFNTVSAVCDLSLIHRNDIYNFSLISPTQKYPHGVLSEDGHYKLCDGMIFNHDPPHCFDCQDCGGPSHCGMTCSALVANDIKDYPVCTTIGRASSIDVDVIDKKNPMTGVVVKMSSSGSEINCSLSVFVFCDSNGLQGPSTLEKLGTCDYATRLRHPSACANVISIHGGGWGWLGTLTTIFLCLLGGYLMAGTVYRFFFLGVRGIEVIPNLEFWLSLPQRMQSILGSLIRKFRRPSEGHRSSYSPVNF
ncbi:uncharacterized protein LOC122086588 isoform X2 [Macadamia integrifolia]|uniref:uncharacterized protein LOC122086588 isoform X2 n=1 Tax=Macadamia integrifolia TaxID=60698 RepID=UPI001C4EBB99|nr:uncharacterized protein LOC122086588 isoform X2 [Macadamia integrifolia]